MVSHVQEVEEARAALRRLCEGFDVDGGHNADTSTEEASRPSEDAFVALRFQIEAIVRTVSGGGSGEDGAKGVGEEVAEGVRSSLEAEVLRLDDTTGLVVAGGGGVVGGMVRAVRGRRGLREGEERALLRLLRSRDDVGREPDKARHFSLMSGDAEVGCVVPGHASTVSDFESNFFSCLIAAPSLRQPVDMLLPPQLDLRKS